MEQKNVLGLISLIIIILFFVIGGYFFMNYMLKNTKPEEKKELIEEIKDYRIDKTKDYIYYENGEEILEEEEIHRDEAILNFKTLTELNETLKEEVENIYGNVKYTKDMDLPSTDSSGNKIVYNENTKGIYSLQYRNYENVKFSNYVSLVAVDFDYDIVKGSIPFNIKSYIVDINTGQLVNEDELLNKYSLTKDIIKQKIKDRLNNTQVLEENIQIIDINGTLNDLKYALYINKVGKVTASFIVKSNKINYNDIVVLN